VGVAIFAQLLAVQDNALADANVASGEHGRSAGSRVTETPTHTGKGAHEFSWSYPRRSPVIMANLSHTYSTTPGHPEAINVVWRYAPHTIAPFHRNGG